MMLLNVFRELLSFSGRFILVLHRPGDGRLQDVLHAGHGLDEHGPVLRGEGGKEGKAISTRTFFGTEGSWRHSSRIAWGSRLSERASEMVALDLPMIPTNVTMKSSSSLVRRWVCREQEPSVGACEAPTAFQVSHIDDGPEPEPRDKLQKTRISDQRDSGKVVSASVCAGRRYTQGEGIARRKYRGMASP